ncbi:MAG: GNAT family N-acetyltransferase [Chloroflexi bacterium]|nr:GNAT family N-acetyltransferase [Chloroflexota bacterium]MBU1747289.1 GNAT family N-acetyltransferase [Chloroflexota bacterium]
MLVLKPETFTTRDGRLVTVRPIRPDDAPRLVAMFHRLSLRSRQLRFHTYASNVDDADVWKQAVALSDLDPQREAALVAVAEEENEEYIVGVARLARATPEDVEAETAIVVRDDYQSGGLGTYLLWRLIPIAHEMGIQAFCAWVMSHNDAVMRIIKNVGLPAQMSVRQGENYMVVPLVPNYKGAA